MTEWGADLSNHTLIYEKDLKVQEVQMFKKGTSGHHRIHIHGFVHVSGFYFVSK